MADLEVSLALPYQEPGPCAIGAFSFLILKISPIIVSVHPIIIERLAIMMTVQWFVLGLILQMQSY